MNTPVMADSWRAGLETLTRELREAINADWHQDEKLNAVADKLEAVLRAVPEQEISADVVEKVRRLARNFSKDWIRPNDPDLASDVLVDTLSTAMLAFHAVARGVESRNVPPTRGDWEKCSHQYWDLGWCCACGIHSNDLRYIEQLRQRAGAVPSPAPASCHKLDTPTQVFFYEQDFYVLSNFSAFTLDWKGHRFTTSEAAYHWEKFDYIRSPDEEQQGTSPTTVKYAILGAPSAHVAFKMAEEYRSIRRPDWDAVRVDVMRQILRAKAEQHEYVRRKLLATGERELIEDSWRDDFWGWGPNRDGQNMLGKLWMEIRSELRGPSPAPATETK